MLAIPQFSHRKLQKVILSLNHCSKIKTIKEKYDNLVYRKHFLIFYSFNFPSQARGATVSDDGKTYFQYFFIGFIIIIILNLTKTFINISSRSSVEPKVLDLYKKARRCILYLLHPLYQSANSSSWWSGKISVLWLSICRGFLYII